MLLETIILGNYAILFNQEADFLKLALRCSHAHEVFATSFILISARILIRADGQSFSSPPNLPTHGHCSLIIVRFIEHASAADMLNHCCALLGISG